MALAFRRDTTFNIRGRIGWGAIQDVNSISIGIELDNDGEEVFAQPEIDSLLRLLTDITTRLQIPHANIVGHADVAPTRKDDPGVRFPWGELAAHGFGLWYDAGALPDPPPDFDPMLALRTIGYDLGDADAADRRFPSALSRRRCAHVGRG